MPETEAIETDDLTEWIRENPPPESVTVRIPYTAAEPRAYHFRGTLIAYDHYLKELYAKPDGPGPVAIAEMFLLDTVEGDERDDLDAFLKTNPGQALILSMYRVANALLDVFNGTLTVEIVRPA